ncbi:MAG: hypothetical protein P1V35_03645 [Planctomycetota bacterium]|nr:hypothetical protein [Planctomycetota bacterium]
MKLSLFMLGAIALGLSATASGQTFGPDFVSDYTFTDLGTPGSVPGNLGGINFKPGDTETLLIGGNANNGSGMIYEVPITRDASGHISAFGGPGVATYTAPYNDGGLCFSSDGVMFVTTFSNNHLLQFLPGSTTPDSDIDLTPLGINSSVGTCQFVPAGFPGAGSFKIGSYSSSEWYDVDLTLNLLGTYDITGVTQTVNTGGGTEGLVYIAGGNPGFTSNAALISEYGANRVSTYDIDANGNPVVATRRAFMNGLSGAEGAVIDPITGDFLFSTFGGGNRVLVVRGFDAPSIYCTGKTNSQGCVPTIEYAGTPTMTGADDFVLTGTDMLNNSFGILLWSTTPGTLQLGGGTICLSGHVFRHPVQFSGGNGSMQGSDCSGTYSDHLDQAWFSANMLSAGTSVYVQYIARDNNFTEPNNYSFSDGLRFTIGQ